MWQALYDRLRQAQAPQPQSADAERDVVFVRHPPADDAEPRCPHCTGVRLVPTEDPERMRCVWCTRVYERGALAAA